MPPSGFGPGQQSAYQEVTLVSLNVTLRLPLARGGGALKKPGTAAFTGVWQSGAGVQNDVSRRVQTFDRGAGFAIRSIYADNAEEWNGFAEGDNICARFGYVCPSGEQIVTEIDPAWGQPIKIISYQLDLFFIFETVIGYKAGGTGAMQSLYSLSGDTWTDAELWQGALRVANTCTHTGVGAGNHHSFLTITGTGSGGPYTTSQPDETMAGGPPYQFSLLQTVFWEYQGVAGTRLVGKVDAQHFRYMIVANGDPYDPLNWGPEVSVGEVSYPIEALVSSHDTLWVIKRDGVYSVTDKNASAGGENITPYWKDQLDDGTTPPSAYYFQSRLIVRRPYGIEAIDVNSWQVQDRPRRIDIAYGRPNETSLNGRYTALGSDNGWLLAAQTSLVPSGLGNARVLYGVDRTRESVVAGITEYDWFPEIGPFESREIVAMHVHTPNATLRPMLWLALKDGSGNPEVISVDLFRGATPRSDPNHRYHTSASITATDEHWGSRRSNKSAVQAVAAVWLLGDGRSIDFYTAAGAGNTFNATPFGTIDTNIESLHWNLYTEFFRANTVRFKAVFTSTVEHPPILLEWELKANLGLPLRRHGTMLVEVGTLTRGDLPSIEDPTAIEVLLVSLAEGLETISMINPEGEHSIIVLHNAVPWEYQERDDSDRRVRVYRLDYTQVS